MAKRQVLIATIVEERKKFWSKVDRNGECWLWTGSTSKRGYGNFFFKRNGIGIQIRAHRYAYEMVNGPVPDGMELDHLCRNHSCIRPIHLEAVTHRENLRRGDVSKSAERRFANQTHCIHGHLLSGGNLYRDSDGHRHCRLCGKEAEARYRLKKKEVKESIKQIDLFRG